MRGVLPCRPKSALIYIDKLGCINYITVILQAEVLQQLQQYTSMQDLVGEMTRVLDEMKRMQKNF